MEKSEYNKKESKFKSYIAPFAVGAILSIILVGFTPSYVPSSSMEPTIPAGSFIRVEKVKRAQQDDIIVFKHNGEKFVKRVIATGGQTVIEDVTGRIFVDNILATTPGGPVKNYKNKECELTKLPARLSTNEYFVIGDNLGNSEDSRCSSVGLVHKDDVIGIVKDIYVINKDGKKEEIDFKDEDKKKDKKGKDKEKDTEVEVEKDGGKKKVKIKKKQ